MTHRCNSDRRLPSDHQVLDEDVVDTERIFRSEGVVLGVVHALDGVHVAEQDVVQPLDRHRWDFPDLGLVVFLTVMTKILRIKDM